MGLDDNYWSNLGFAEEAAIFKGPTQNARVLSEGWIAAYGFCLSCGTTPLTAFAANSPVADFHCRVCAEEYELKAKRSAGPQGGGRGLCHDDRAPRGAEQSQPDGHEL